MQDNRLFEYAVIRVVPRVDREEFLNVGVILYSRDYKFLQAKYTIDEKRLKAFSPELDIELVKNHICAFDKICSSAVDGGPIATLNMASRFRWLTATKSTIVQTSKVHPGLTKDPQQTLIKLHNELVL
ncbi:MAG: DUF3037 domain-containing protein [Chitinophagaceae bacterium]|nr:DUF3037 domain-containing protein [Chitinophagaceae bacterium]